MRKQISVPSLFPWLIIIVISAVVGKGRGEQRACSSSCGPLSIRSPFSLNGNPDYCGNSKHDLTPAIFLRLDHLIDMDPLYETTLEVTCDNSNRTFLELRCGKYYVTNIWYENKTMRVVDASLAASSCRLPLCFPYDGSYFDNTSVAAFDGPIYVGLVSCSEKISNKTYHHVPCLSGNSTYVYALFDWSVGALLPSCSFRSMVPTDHLLENVGPFFPKVPRNSSVCLQSGFPVRWFLDVQKTPNLTDCVKKASSEIRDDNRQRDATFIWFLYPYQFGYKVIDCLEGGDLFGDLNRSLRLAVVLLDIVISLLVIAAIAAIARLVIAPLCIYVFLTYEYWKMISPINAIEKFLQNQQTLTPTRYAYTDIIAMTNNFKEKLGQGGFGSVFKGELLGGRLLVAVKLLGNSKCNGEDFINEVATIGRIHHHHVVRLLGFCADGTKNALVYEFMHNGSLDRYIFSPNGAHRRFTMEKLNEIALGVARGIDYLHRGCEMSILHFDIKPHNVLLDKNFEPKIADFGLAKLYSKDYSIVSVSAARGTIGYIAPELVSRSFGVISHKSDVYSFGMLLMEMAGGRRNVDNSAENSSQVYYPSWIYDQLKKSEQPEIGISVTIDDMEKKLCKIGLWCIQMRPSDRPSMSKVIEMLEAEVDTLEMAPKPFVSTQASVPVRQSDIDSSLSRSSFISEDD